MRNRAPLIASALIIAGMALVSALAWPKIPAGTSIAVHFDLLGRPNGFAGKATALAILPLIGCGLTLLFTLLPILRPDAANERAASGPAYRVAWMGTLLLLAVAHVLIVMRARGTLVNVPGDATFFLALMICAVGNFLGKTRPNSFVGVRTFWTRSSEYSWDKSNRATGRMLVAAGLIGMGAIAVVGKVTAFRILLGAILLASLTGVLLSYYYWRTDPDRARN